MKKRQIEEETQVRELVPTTPVANFKSAKERIVFLECLCFQLKKAADLARIESDRARDALSSAENRENQLLNQISNLEEKIIDQNKKLQELELKLTEAIAKKTEASTMADAIKHQYILENEITTLENQRGKRSMTFLTEKFNFIRTRLGYLESAYEKLFNKMLQLYNLSQKKKTGDFDLAEFIAELRAEILSLEQKIVNADQREMFLQRAYDNSISEIIHYKKQNATSDNLSLNPENTCTKGDKKEQLLDVSRTRSNEANPPDQDMVDIPGDTLHKQDILFDKSISETDRPLIELFLKDLTEGPEAMRPRAATRLIDFIGEKAAFFIVKTATSTREPAVRASLITEVGKINSLPPSTLHSIISYFLEDDESIVRSAAIDTCIRLATSSQEDQLPLIQKAMKDSSPLVRRKALVFAATSTEIDPGFCCQELLLDPDHNIRRLAAASFTSTKNPQALLMLFTTVQDQNHNVSIAAAYTISQIFGDALKNFPHLPDYERYTAAEKLTTYITTRYNSFFPNGKVLLPSQYSALFPSEMHIQLEEQKTQFLVTPDTDTDMYLHADADTNTATDTDTETTLTMSTIITDKKQESNLPSMQKICSFIQSSLMGCSVEDIAHEFSVDFEALEQRLNHYILKDKIIKRGKKLFLP